jgi:hypothetical protein
MESGSRLSSFFTDELVLEKIVQKQKSENEKSTDKGGRVFIFPTL